ncbi:urea transporter [Vibrio sp. 10N.261.46.E11]|uniref:urea transporter n=1 Tax=Vibrio sp. 10N.261.46.E11 TaxID=3229662 RepID=UPI00354AFABA
MLNGIGQVYFTPSVVTSLLLLLAISVESIPLACLTLLGASCSYTLARYTHNSINSNSKTTYDLNSGMYALNGALIGLFIGNVFGVTPILAAVTVFGALLTAPFIDEAEGYDIPVGSVGLAWVSGHKPIRFMAFLDVIRGIIIRMKSQLYFFYSI